MIAKLLEGVAALRFLLACAVASSPLAAARAETSATAALTPESVAAVTLRPARLLGDPKLQWLPVEVVEAACQKYAGLSAKSIERVTVVAEPPMGVQPYYAVAVDLAEPLSFDTLHPEVLEFLAEFTTRTELEGRVCYQSKQPMAPSLYMPDDHTVWAAPTWMLNKLLRQHAGGEVPSGPLVKKMTSGEGNQNDLHAAVMLEPLRPFIQLGMMQARTEAEPRFHKYLDAVGLLKGVVLSVDLSGQRDTLLNVQANNADDAQQLEGLLDEFIEMIRADTFDDPLSPYAQLRASDDPVQQALADYMLRYHTEQINQFRPTRSGDTSFDILRTKINSTGVEPLFMVATVGVLVALLLPAVQAAREAARRNQSKNNLKRLILSMLNYESAHRNFPAQAIYAEDGTPLLSWRVAVLPFLEDGNELYARFHLDEPWDSPHNIQLLPLMPEVFIDPSSDLATTDGKTHYLGVSGPRAVFSGEMRGRSLAKITDGTSRTVAIVQVDDSHAIEWTKPADYDAEKYAANPVGGIGGLHNGQFLFAMCDGSVHTAYVEVDPEVLRAAFTRDGGEPVTLP